MVGSGLRRRLASVRVRTTLAATLVVGVSAIVAGVILLGLLRATMMRSVDALAQVRTSDVAALARSGSLRDPIPTPFEESSLVQVLDGTGRVVASSANLEGQAPILDLASLRASSGPRTVQQLPVGEEGAFRLVVARATTSQGTLVILVASSLGPINSTLHQVSLALLLALPILLGVVAVTAWIMTGRTLSPVESIRAEVAEISTREMGRRVPVPATSDEIERLARTMNSMLDRLEAARDRERRFVADASHELRSPITAARAQLETALAHPRDVDWPAIATTVLHEELSMERLITELLLLARADHGALPQMQRPFDLREVVLQEVDRLPRRDGLTVDISRVSEVLLVGDPDQLARVIRNLVENAQRHAISTVRVDVGVSGDEAEVVVTDDGPGIPRSERERVFDRFTRLDEARSRRSGGVGLGLSIAREIVAAHSGTVAVTDSAKGTRIVIRLPYAAQA